MIARVIILLWLAWMLSGCSATNYVMDPFYGCDTAYAERDGRCFVVE